MMMMMELSRGHSESAIKSERVGEAWRDKKQAAREGKPQPAKRDNRVNGMKILTHRLPAWVEERGGKLRLIPARAAVVKRIYELTLAGYGAHTIARRLNEEKVPVMGLKPHWLRSYVADILSDKRAAGEYQPGRRNGDKDGDPIPGYFPAVVTEAEWGAARGCTVKRREKRTGRVGGQVNVFSGLLKDARDGASYYRDPACGKRRHAVLVNHGAKQATSSCRSFPLDTFEKAILSRLAEIDPHDILNGDAGPDETIVLAGELTNVEAKIAEFEAELLRGDVAALARTLRQLEARKAELVQKLTEARQKAAHPLSESWGETQSLVAALDGAKDQQDARLRLRAALRRIVEGIWMLVVPEGRNRICAAQIWFAGGERRRDYLIVHRPPKSNGKVRTDEGGWMVESLAAVVAADDLDLRRPDHAARLEKALAAAELAGLKSQSGG
jgi:hypothetical protein